MVMDSHTDGRSVESSMETRKRWKEVIVTVSSFTVLAVLGVMQVDTDGDSSAPDCRTTVSQPVEVRYRPILPDNPEVQPDEPALEPTPQVDE
jgi:hypothetical protein